MKPDFIFALYVFCQDYHSGQNSRLYRLLSRVIQRYNPKLSDNAYNAIREDLDSDWYDAHCYYQELREKYGTDIK